MKTAALPQSLLRRVETHVRVMSFPEYFEHTTRQPGDNSLTIRGGGGGNNNNNNSNEGSSSPAPPTSRTFSGFTRVHQNYTTSLDNALFYEDTLRKIVPAALAGQSFTVLFCGAPCSGRSQTMYTIDGRRNGGQLTYGMLHYLAQDLLEKQNVRVLVSAYHVRGHKVFDSRNDKPVNVRHMHSPLGATPECTSVLLEKPEDAMIVPNDKRANGSCFVTFEIYHQMGGGGGGGGAAATPNGGDDAGSPAPEQQQQQPRRGAFSMITFVDVASFDDPLPSDVVMLRGSIQRHLAGSDPQFGSCRLSEMLESSICRGRSLIGVSTVVGQPASLFEKTANVLEFTSLLSRIEQVATVCQFLHPKWLPELPAKIKELDELHEERCRRNYERGVSEVYFALRNAFTAKLQAVEQHMAENSEASANLAKMRGDLKDKLEQALRQLEAAARDEEQRIERNTDKAHSLKKENDTSSAAAEQEAEVLRLRAHDLYLQRSSIEQQQAEVSHELAINDENRRRHNRSVEELQQNVDADVAATRDSKKNCLRAQDRIRLHWSQHQYESALAKITAAKETAATQLSEATARAVIQDQSQRAERQQRKTLGPSLQNTQQQQQQQNAGAKRASGSRRERSQDSRHGSQQQVVLTNRTSMPSPSQQ